MQRGLQQGRPLTEPVTPSIPGAPGSPGSQVCKAPVPTAEMLRQEAWGWQGTQVWEGFLEEVGAT